MARPSSAANCASSCSARSIRPRMPSISSPRMCWVTSRRSRRAKPRWRGSSISRRDRSRAPTNTGCGDLPTRKGAANPIHRCVRPRLRRASRIRAQPCRRRQAGRRRKSKTESEGEEAMTPFRIAALALFALGALARCGAGLAQDRDRADQQLGEPGADARRGRRHLQEAQSQDRGVRHAGCGRDDPGGGVGLGRSRRGCRRRRRDARVLSAARRCACCCRRSPAPATSTGT